ncbi:phospholipase D-like domain-containing protein [Paenibacillaceae bacterium WGS1546]|uniref:phospholipase D-like domain-containing protein n=1 Tax=Cohnella sp. WGS1546 TaxID=3366810 RepID=UPI00372D5DDB
MNITFLGQGLKGQEDEQLGETLKQSFLDEKYNEFLGFIAFVTEGGVNRFIKEYEDFSNKPENRSTLYIGVDQESTPQSALELLLHLGFPVYVYHNLNPSVIYHPKIYIFKSETYNRVIIGSSNLTGTGLFTSVEASLMIDFTDEEENEHHIISNIESYFDGFLSAPPTNPNLQPLSRELIDRLVEAKIVPRTRINYKKTKLTAERTPETLEIRESLKKEYFPSTTARRIPPRTDYEMPDRYMDIEEDDSLDEEQTTEPTTEPTTTEPTTAALTRTLVWRKNDLKRTDAQYVPTGYNTNPTGNLRLAQAGFKVYGSIIDQTTYFRHDVFGSLNWSTRQRVGNSPLEVANTLFHIEISGISQGVFDLQISHDLDRVAGQGNVPTIIHWGSALPTIRRTNLMGFNLEMYRLTGTNEFVIAFS